MEASRCCSTVMAMLMVVMGKGDLYSRVKGVRVQRRRCGEGPRLELITMVHECMYSTVRVRAFPTSQPVSVWVRFR